MFSGKESSSPLNDVAGRFTPYIYLGPTLIAVGLFIRYLVLLVLVSFSGMGSPRWSSSVFPII
jgi:hypothetical protein